MLEALIQSFWSVVLSMYGEEEVKEIIDAAIDKVEDKIEASENKIDDWMLMPPIKALREYFDIPDNDVE